MPRRFWLWVAVAAVAVGVLMQSLPSARPFVALGILLAMDTFIVFMWRRHGRVIVVASLFMGIVTLLYILMLIGTPS